MSAPELLAELARAGVRVSAQGGLLRLRGPSGAVSDPEILDRVRRAKPELLAALIGAGERPGGAIDTLWRASVEKVSTGFSEAGVRPDAETFEGAAALAFRIATPPADLEDLASGPRVRAWAEMAETWLAEVCAGRARAQLMPDGRVRVRPRA